MDLSNRIESASDMAAQLEQINAWLELNPGELSPEAITALKAYAGAVESMLETGNALLQIGVALNAIEDEAGAGP